MELSDTIVAASIGAMATVITASFQLVNAMRSSRSETRPKNGRTLRSVISIVALMAASGVGGYMFSEVRHQRTTQDLREMRDEMNAKLLALATATERLAAERHEVAPPLQLATSGELRSDAAADASKPRMSQPNRHSIDAEVFVPACVLGPECNEATAERSSVCGIIPKDASITQVDHFLASDADSKKFRQVAAEQDVGGAKFLSPHAELPHDADHKSACVELLHWSSTPHVARVEVHYVMSDAGTELATATPAAVVSTGANRNPSVLSY